MLYYNIFWVATVNAVFCDAGDGDHQNDGYDSDTLFTMGMTRLRGASPVLVKHRHQSQILHKNNGFGRICLISPFGQPQNVADVVTLAGLNHYQSQKRPVRRDDLPPFSVRS